MESQFSFETATWSGSLRIMSSVPLKAGRGLIDRGEVLDRCGIGKDHQVLRLVEVAWFTATKT